jgi:hypothetical protein
MRKAAEAELDRNPPPKMTLESHPYSLRALGEFYDQQAQQREAAADPSARKSDSGSFPSALMRAAAGGSGRRDTSLPGRRWSGWRTSAGRCTSARTGPCAGRSHARAPMTRREGGSQSPCPPGSSSQAQRPRASPARARARGADQRCPSSQGASGLITWICRPGISFVIVSARPGVTMPAVKAKGPRAGCRCGTLVDHRRSR